MLLVDYNVIEHSDGEFHVNRVRGVGGRRIEADDISKFKNGLPVCVTIRVVCLVVFSIGVIVMVQKYVHASLLHQKRHVRHYHENLSAEN